MIDVSIVMSSYKRANLLRVTLASIERQRYSNLEVVVCEDGYDGGWTKAVCEGFGARYFLRSDRPDQPYSNPAIPTNIAIQQARGEIIIIQNPECRHAGPDVIERLVAPHLRNDKLAVMATVRQMSRDGNPMQWYCHPVHRPVPYFFCGSIRKKPVLEAGGFDEDFGRGVGGYGYDDDFFAFCLARQDVSFQFRDDIPVEHQWHEGTDCYGLQSNKDLFDSKIRDVMDGNVEGVANAGRAWGVFAEAAR